jgi:hypothetical protein
LDRGSIFESSLAVIDFFKVWSRQTSFKRRSVDSNRFSSISPRAYLFLNSSSAGSLSAVERLVRELFQRESVLTIHAMPPKKSPRTNHTENANIPLSRPFGPPPTNIPVTSPIAAQNRKVALAEERLDRKLLTPDITIRSIPYCRKWSTVNGKSIALYANED